MSTRVEIESLSALRTAMAAALQQLDAVLAELGCLHHNASEVTTMDGTNIRKFLCPDCGEVIEEEIQNGLEIQS